MQVGLSNLWQQLLIDCRIFSSGSEFVTRGICWVVVQCQDVSAWKSQEPCASSPLWLEGTPGLHREWGSREGREYWNKTCFLVSPYVFP